MNHTHLFQVRTRFGRHLLFWISWVLGFTFIKSLGGSFHTYISWFVYYLTTLPIFMAHTYLLVYWVFKKFRNGTKLFIAFLLFLIFLYAFSFLELLLTESFLASIFPDVFSQQHSYQDPATVIISSIGNLYIILVFIAAKLIREWYIASEQKQELLQQQLLAERAEVNYALQPGMLLFCLEQIEFLAKRGSKKISSLISDLSEILNLVMQLSMHDKIPLADEIDLIKKMQKIYRDLELHSTKLTFLNDNIADRTIPRLMLFTPIEMLMRFDTDQQIARLEIQKIDLKNAEITPYFHKSKKGILPLTKLRNSLEELYPGRFTLYLDTISGAEKLMIAVN